MARVLIIDDDSMFCTLLVQNLEDMGHEASCAHTLREGLLHARSEKVDIVLLDIYLPDGNGLDLMPEIRATASSPEVIIITGGATKESAALAITNGAWDYILKPSPLNEMRLIINRAIQYRQERFKKVSSAELSRDGIIGNSARMHDSLDLLSEAASTDIAVIITGETGTGKELFARAIHGNSSRSEGNFVVVDCATLHDMLTELTLFGYVKGAFTGAVNNHTGLISQSDAGTLFLDEAGELPLSLQKVFLRVLQERRFRPLGANREIPSNFRLIVATNRNLDEMVRTGQFREDLYYRLRALTINLPPLREHKEDIIAIAGYHAQQICKRNGYGAKTFSPDFMNALLAYDWPGNIRELVHAVERSIAAAQTATEIVQRHLPHEIRIKLIQRDIKPAAIDSGEDMGMDGEDSPPTLKNFRETIYAQAEKEYLTRLLRKSSGGIPEVCRAAGVSRPRLYELLKKHQISTKG